MARLSAKYMGTTSSQRSMVAKAKARRTGYKRTAIPTRINRILRSTGRKGEIKAVDLPFNANGAQLNVNTTATFSLMNGIQEGSSFYNRIGRKVELKSLHLKLAAVNIGNATTSGDYQRILVIYDRQVNGTVPAIADVLLAYDNAGTALGPTALSEINLDKRERFVILMDERVYMPASTALGVVIGVADPLKTTMQINRFIKLRGLLTHYQASTNPAVVANIATGALYLVTLGSNAPNAQSWNWTYAARLRFDDT